jgi:hypothetical protein
VDSKKTFILVGCESTYICVDVLVSRLGIIAAAFKIVIVHCICSVNDLFVIYVCDIFNTTL